MTKDAQGSRGTTVGNMLEGAISTLRHHPFQVMELAGREKFHTGLLAYALSQEDAGRAFYHALTGLPAPSPLNATCEHESIDLVVTDSDDLGRPWHAIFEAKFRSELGRGQLARIDKRLQKRVGPPPAKFLISVVPPTDMSTLAARGFEWRTFTQDVAAALESSLDRVGNEEARVLLGLWKRYLEAIHVIATECAQADPARAWELREAIRGLKLKGLFERIRLQSVYERLKQEFTEPPVDRAHERVTLANTHGNALLEINLWHEGNGRIRYGIQWQSEKAKFFVSREDASRIDEAGRRLLLEELAPGLREVAALSRRRPGAGDRDVADVRANRAGRFRSVTLAIWDVWEDRDEAVERMIALGRHLESDPFCRRRIGDWIDRQTT